MLQQIDSQSLAQALIPFTGYYTLDASVGSFVMIDTHMVCTVPGPNMPPVNNYVAQITICSDGKTSAQYSLGTNCTFDGTNLVVTDASGALIANLILSSTSGDSSLSGTIDGRSVAGSTPFGPVRLSLWNGTYYAQGPAILQSAPVMYPYMAALQVDPDGTVLYAPDGGSLQPVQEYWYDFGMFVIGLMIDPAKPHLFEMGTSTGWGRVAGNAEKGKMLVSIQQQEPAPAL